MISNQLLDLQSLVQKELLLLPQLIQLSFYASYLSYHHDELTVVHTRMEDTDQLLPIGMIASLVLGLSLKERLLLTTTKLKDRKSLMTTCCRVYSLLPLKVVTLKVPKRVKKRALLLYLIAQHHHGQTHPRLD